MKITVWRSIWLWLLVGAMLIGVVASASAMSSPNFLLNWYVNLTAAGGGRSSSTNTSANFTIGQNAAWAASSSNFKAGLGYWAAFPFTRYIYAPVIMGKP